MFIDEKFMLESDSAIEIYNSIKDLPIIDFHSHLSAKEIYDNKRYEDLGQMWLEFDHYKWRAMRTVGIDEKYITGNSSYEEKFLAWGKTMDYTMFNPLYHWSHLELVKYFNIEEELTEESAKRIFDETKKQIQSGKVDVQEVLRTSKVRYIATTDDPIDSLEYHQKLKGNSEFIIKPTFRPDKLYKLTEDTKDYLEKLSEISEVEIIDVKSFKEAIVSRINFFNEIGGKISDHGLDTLHYVETTEEEFTTVFDKILSSTSTDENDALVYQSYMLKYLISEYNKVDWVVQLHIGVIRNNNTNLLETLGRDVGADSVNGESYAQSLNLLLDSLDEIPKTIVYTLNPGDYLPFATAIGNFQQKSKGRLQFGSGWWHMDTEKGMIEQLETLSSVGLLRTFVGMLTDSRSFLSFTRHDYFRRILANYIAKQYDTRKVVQDIEVMKKIAIEISHDNAVEYFRIEEE